MTAYETGGHGGSDHIADASKMIESRLIQARKITWHLAFLNDT